MIASCGLMLATGLRLAEQAATGFLFGAIIVGSAAVLALTAIKPVWVIVSAIVLGLIVTA